MNIPSLLYRYRPLDERFNERIEQELDALSEAYLYAPSFSHMNDPMESIIRFNNQLGISDNLFCLNPQVDLYNMNLIVQKEIEKLGLISFSKTAYSYPLWAYYAYNFQGFCLEFETVNLQETFDGEVLTPVNYSNDIKPNFNMIEILISDRNSLLNLTRQSLSWKRIEWKHEDEYRFIVGEVGKKHYFENSLKKIYLGVGIDDKLKKEICDIFKNRPTEILQGKISNYSLKFVTIQTPKLLSQCERVGKGDFNLNEKLFSEEINEIKNFLKVPYDSFIKLCENFMLHPNMEQFHYICLLNNRLEVWVNYKVRSQTVLLAPVKYYYDNQLNLIGKE